MGEHALFDFVCLKLLQFCKYCRTCQNCTVLNIYEVNYKFNFIISIFLLNLGVGCSLVSPLLGYKPKLTSTQYKMYIMSLVLDFIFAASLDIH